MRSVDGQVCPKCGNGILIDLPSINKKMCSTCPAYFEWSLKDGQKSVTIDKYIGGRDEEETAHVRVKPNKQQNRGDDMDEIYTKVVLVTPEGASNFLSTNEGNRVLIDSKIQSYADQMADGAWKLNGETISISDHGRLLNGQHRMLAIIRCGAAIPLNIAFGVDESTFDTFDTGANRTASTSLNMYGLKVAIANILAVQIRLNLMMRYSSSIADNRRMQRYTTPAAILEEYKLDPDYLAAAEFVYAYPRNQRLIGGGHMAFLVYRFFKIDREFSEDWVGGLITGSGLGVNDYRLWLRDRLWKDKQSHRRLTVKAKDYLVIKAWYWARQGKIIEHAGSLTVDKKILKRIGLPADYTGKKE